MLSHRLPTVILAIALLLSGLGCAKKDSPKPVVDTGSYLLDGTTIACTATAEQGVWPASSRLAETNYIHLVLTTTPQSGAGPRLLHVYYQKFTYQATADYQANILYLESGNATTVYVPTASQCTLTFDSNGRVSGTFSAAIASSTLPASLITSGTFANVLVQ